VHKTLHPKTVPIGTYSVTPFFRTIPDVVPCSDLAGSVAAISPDLEDGRWKIGDRVAANFSPKHLSGTITPEIFAASFGAKVHGVLAEYRVVPADVSASLSFVFASVPVPSSRDAYAW